MAQLVEELGRSSGLAPEFGRLRARWRKEKGHLLSSSASSQVTLSLLPCPSRFPLSHSSPLVLLLALPPACLLIYTLLALFLSLRLALSVSRCPGGPGKKEKIIEKSKRNHEK